MPTNEGYLESVDRGQRDLARAAAAPRHQSPPGQLQRAIVLDVLSNGMLSCGLAADDGTTTRTVLAFAWGGAPGIGDRVFLVYDGPRPYPWALSPGSGGGYYGGGISGYIRFFA